MSDSSAPSVEHVSPAVVVHVRASELRKPEVDAICAAVDAARVDAPSSPFILDMTQVGFAGSLALGVLIGLGKEFRSREQPLIFVNLQPEVRQSMEIIRMNKVVELLPDVPTALSRLGADA